MGIRLSKNKEKKEINIRNFSSLTIPKEYELLKMATYNINIHNIINIYTKLD